MPEGTSVAAMPMAGGWSLVDPYDPDVQEAARFAVQTFAIQNKTRILFKDVWQARQQVATGRRSELLLEVTQNGVRFRAKALVMHHHGGLYSLNEWVWQD